MESKNLGHLNLVLNVICLVGIIIVAIFTGIFHESYGGKKQISSDKAPGAIAPYSQAMFAGNFLFVSGQIGMNASGFFVNKTVGGQAYQALKNIEVLLEAADLDFSNVVKATVLLQNIDDFGEVNKVYEAFFPDPKPARAAFAVNALPRHDESLVEIEVIANKG